MKNSSRIWRKALWHQGPYYNEVKYEKSIFMKHRRANTPLEIVRQSFVHKEVRQKCSGSIMASAEFPACTVIIILRFPFKAYSRHCEVWEVAHRLKDNDYRVKKPIAEMQRKWRYAISKQMYYYSHFPEGNLPKNCPLDMNNFAAFLHT